MSDISLSFWDAMILCSAQQMQCSILWTEDLNNGQSYDGVLVKNHLFKKPVRRGLLIVILSANKIAVLKDSSFLCL